MRCIAVSDLSHQLLEPALRRLLDEVPESENKAIEVLLVFHPEAMVFALKEGVFNRYSNLLESPELSISLVRNMPLANVELDIALRQLH